MRKPTILLAGNRDEDILLLQRVFEKLDLQDSLRVVREGREAVEYLSGSTQYADRRTYPSPSMLILDAATPNKTGELAMRWLKGKPELQRMFVVVMTTGQRRFAGDKLFNQFGNIVFFNYELLRSSTASVDRLVKLFESWLPDGEQMAALT